MVIYSVAVSRLLIGGEVYSKGDLIPTKDISSFQAAVRSKALQLVTIDEKDFRKAKSPCTKVRSKNAKGSPYSHRN